MTVGVGRPMAMFEDPDTDGEPSGVPHGKDLAEERR